MKVVITGGAGYLGERLCKALIKKRTLIDRFGQPCDLKSIVLIARSFLQSPRPTENIEGISVVRSGGTVTDRPYLETVISGEHVTVFHLAAVLPGVTERDLKSGIDINVLGTRNVLDALADCGEGSRLVMASSITVFGPQAQDSTVSDRSVVQPGTVYGHTKAISELLVSAYSLAGKLDGRCARLSTVVVRPQKVGASAGASISDALRDITLGNPCDVVLRPSTRAAIAGYDSCIDGLMRLQILDRSELKGNITLDFPALTASIQEMIDVASATARRHGRIPGAINYAPNHFAQSVIDGWPVAVDGRRAKSLGIMGDTGLEELCERVIATANDVKAQ